MLSRPFVVLPCPFLCAMLSLLCEALFAQRRGLVMLDALLCSRDTQLGAVGCRDEVALRLNARLCSINTRYPQRGQGLPMPLFAAIAFPPPMFEDNDFFAPLLGDNLGFDPHTGHSRCANCHLCALPNEMHVGQCDCLANSSREFFYINRVAWTHSILPTTRRHNRVHTLSYPILCPQEQVYLILRRAITAGTLSGQALIKL